jgi:hypothetical protein
MDSQRSCPNNREEAVDKYVMLFIHVHCISSSMQRIIMELMEFYLPILRSGSQAQII